MERLRKQLLRAFLKVRKLVRPIATIVRKVLFMFDRATRILLLSYCCAWEDRLRWVFVLAGKADSL